MLEDRRHARTDCNEKCLINLKGWYYPATVRNISLRGALVTPGNPLSDVRSGAPCNIIMSEDSFREYFCSVVRASRSDVALRIIDGYNESPFTHIIARLHGEYRKYRSLKIADRTSIAGRTKWSYFEGTTLSAHPKSVQM